MLANFLRGLWVLLVPLLFHLISQGDVSRWQTVLLLLFTAASMVLISSASYALPVRGLLAPTEQQTSP